nr:hypothetical protein [Planosporangium mesophilum]
MSLFGVEARPASPLDFEGLLAGAGQVVRMGGTARVSIVVDQPWRARALLVEARARGLAASCEPATVEGHLGFRTAYSSALATLGVAWLRGAVKHPPRGLALDGRRLRLWAIAAGGRDGAAAFTLRLGAGDEPMWGIVGGALAAAGLPAVLLGPRAGGPAYRIVGRRRLARLAELVGDPPSGASVEYWV